MIRTLIVAGCAVGLAGCQPVSGDAGAGTGRGALEAVPPSYDWHLVERGDAAVLDYGDGVADAAGGVRLFRLACRAHSRQIQASWDGPGEAVLTSGTATDTVRRDADLPASHPVLAALRQGAALAVGWDDGDLTLTARDAGQGRIAAFFDVCTRPQAAPAPEPPAPAVLPDLAPPSEGDDQPDDLAGGEPVEPGVDVVQPEGSAQQPVDR